MNSYLLTTNECVCVCVCFAFVFVVALLAQCFVALMFGMTLLRGLCAALRASMHACIWALSVTCVSVRMRSCASCTNENLKALVLLA